VPYDPAYHSSRPCSLIVAPDIFPSSTLLGSLEVLVLSSKTTGDHDIGYTREAVLSHSWMPRTIHVAPLADLSTQLERVSAEFLALIPAGFAVAREWDFHFLRTAHSAPRVSVLAAIGGYSPAWHVTGRVDRSADSAGVEWLLTHAPAAPVATEYIPPTILFSRRSVLLAAARTIGPTTEWEEYVSRLDALVRSKGGIVALALRVTALPSRDPSGPPRSPAPTERPPMSRLQHRWHGHLNLRSEATTVKLHVAHSWGGGLEKWVRDYSSSDAEARHLVLRSLSASGRYGRRIALFASAVATEPILFWEPNEPITSVAIAHLEYPDILEEIIERFAVSQIIVSSFIGHSLDVLLASVPVTVIAHDYFPICPAIGLHFDSVCRTCDSSRLLECARSNPLNTFFPDAGEPRWIDVRRAYVEYLVRRQIPIVAPTQSVRRHYCQLLPELHAARWHIVPHGLESRLEPVAVHGGARPRILVLGRLDNFKGVGLLSEALPSLVQRADIYLVGCGARAAEKFHDRPHVHARPYYEDAELRSIVEEIGPDLGLLTSIVPETFSYTLEELRRFGIPPVATNVGSFADRIEHGKTGLLYEPTSSALLEMVQGALDNRESLSAIRRQLHTLPTKPVADMVADYNRIQRGRLRWPHDRKALGNGTNASEGRTGEQVLSSCRESLASHIDAHPALGGRGATLAKALLWAWLMPPRAALWAWRRTRSSRHRRNREE
jgi:glycosyltransferase involved in cell wall biosynthesis